MNIYNCLYSLVGTDDCNFIGHLANEPDSCVAMTGCLGYEDVDFTIMSPHTSGATMFQWTKEGNVRLIQRPIDLQVRIYSKY